MALLQRLAAHGQTWGHVAKNRADRHGDDGQGAIEYVGLAVIIGIVIAVIIQFDIGHQLTEILSGAIDKLAN
jgi:Flp pilus assembly pilin Flp